MKHSQRISRCKYRKRSGKIFICARTQQVCPYDGDKSGDTCSMFKYGKHGGAENRQKGHNAERRLVRLCKEFGYDAKRNLGETRNELQGVDVVICDKYYAQVKCGNRIPLKRAIKQLRGYDKRRVFIYFEDTELHEKGVVILVDKDCLKEFLDFFIGDS